MSARHLHVTFVRCRCTEPVYASVCITRQALAQRDALTLQHQDISKHISSSRAYLNPQLQHLLAPLHLLDVRCICIITCPPPSRSHLHAALLHVSSTLTCQQRQPLTSICSLSVTCKTQKLSLSFRTGSENCCQKQPGIPAVKLHLHYIRNTTACISTLDTYLDNNKHSH